MNDLSERIKDIVVKYLIAETRSYTGVIDKEKQAKALVAMIGAGHIKSLFEFSKDTYSREKEYQSQLEKLLANRNQQTIESANNERQEIFQKVIRELIDRTEDEAQSKGAAKDAWKLRKQIDDLKAELEFGKPASAVTFWDRLSSRVNLPYLVILSLVVVLVGGLVFIGMTATMTVSVDFSIGEIIGGLLVGTGVAAAGISYATRDAEQARSDNQ